ncbi:hypothetical protein D910_09330 [Dendroctonus ponderosae]|uniref:Ubiquitin-like domain-containing protein n=1 Tax=Dendroctonus ponderosae TaxID=77166 RepID=U4UI34_DENPD|nr:hypothetical protein D910_09330 [Dendroctonus ponderosae]KAH1026835.1 hypothetical protein HUJ05_000448 [Dendroctonus ponderosae]
MSNRHIPADKINLRLILVSGKTKEYLFSPSDSAGDIAQHVFDHWPEDWRQEAVAKAEILRLIYQGRFLHSNVTLGALGLPFGKTTVMHLVPRENLPEPNSQDMLNPTPMDTLSIGEMQKPFYPAADNEQQLFFCISSNGYYGYQPVRGENVPEPMHIDDSDKTCLEPCRGVKRKLATDSEITTTWKRKCHYEPPMPPVESSPCLKSSPTKRYLEEDLLRETHGCSYYHWVASL